MIPGVNIIRGKARVASVNGAGMSGRDSQPLSRRFRGRSSLWKFLGSKEHLDWLKIDLNVAEIRTVQDCKHTKNSCECKYIYTVLKLRVKQVTYEPKYNGNTKRPKPKENQLRILKIYGVCQKFSRGPWAQERALLGLCVSLREYTKKIATSFSQKLLQLYLVVQRRSIVVTWLKSVSRLHADTSSPDIYWRKQLNRQVHLELCHRGPDIQERVLNRIVLSDSIVGKCAPMQVIKEPEYGRTSTNEEQKRSSFQMNMINS